MNFGILCIFENLHVHLFYFLQRILKIQDSRPKTQDPKAIPNTQLMAQTQDSRLKTQTQNNVFVYYPPSPRTLWDTPRPKPNPNLGPKPKPNPRSKLKLKLRPSSLKEQTRIRNPIGKNLQLPYLVNPLEISG